jgi:UPF0716 family protein affecting phage T7 exclusion
VRRGKEYGRIQKILIFPQRDLWSVLLMENRNQQNKQGQNQQNQQQNNKQQNQQENKAKNKRDKLKEE